MHKLKKTIVLSSVFLAVYSLNASATVFTFGNLSSDDTTNFIVDTVTGRKYTRFDAVQLSYADTLTAISPGGLWDGWQMASSAENSDFINAMFSTSNNPCTDQPNTYAEPCGSLTGWTEGAFGETGTQTGDYYFYLSTEETIGRDYPIGHVTFWAWGDIIEYDDSVDITTADNRNSQYQSNQLPPPEGVV